MNPFLEALDKVLQDHCTFADVRRIEAGGSSTTLWQTVEQAGFLDLLLPEEQGGAALALVDLFPILVRLGRAAMPLPVAQSVVARALLAQPERLPPGRVTLAMHLETGPGGGLVSHCVPYGSVADYVVCCEGDGLVLMACADATRVAVGDGRSLGATLQWPDAKPLLREPGGAAGLRAFAPAMAAALLSGAMQQTFALALDYCNTRVQFGKQLGKFQAIQQQLSVMAEHLLAGALAAESAFHTTSRTPPPLAAALAKSRTSEAAALVAATAHAVHGAIGMTDVYDLGLLTRRLHDWRISYGSENHWNRVVGHQLLASGAGVVDFVRLDQAI